MKKFKAFNFIELLLVMLVLGVIISLTMPLIKDLKNSGSIHRSYMKKALQDVSDAYTMVMMRNNLTGIDRLGAGDVTARNARLTATHAGLRYLFNTAINGLECGVASGDGNYQQYTNAAGNIQNCVSTAFPQDASVKRVAPANDAPGIVIGGKSTMVFLYNTDIAGQYGYVYVDMNGNKTPNKICEDRYRFIIYRDHIVMDMQDATWGCQLEIQN